MVSSLGFRISGSSTCIGRCSGAGRPRGARTTGTPSARRVRNLPFWSQPDHAIIILREVLGVRWWRRGVPSLILPFGREVRRTTGESISSVCRPSPCVEVLRAVGHTLPYSSQAGRFPPIRLRRIRLRRIWPPRSGGVEAKPSRRDPSHEPLIRQSPVGDRSTEIRQSPGSGSAGSPPDLASAKRRPRGEAEQTGP